MLDSEILAADQGQTNFSLRLRGVRLRPPTFRDDADASPASPRIRPRVVVRRCDCCRVRPPLPRLRRDRDEEDGDEPP